MQQYEIMIKKMSEQIAKLSEESAMYYSLFATEKAKTIELEKELETLKGKDELNKNDNE